MTVVNLIEVRALCAAATPEPWFWKINLGSKQIVLESHGRGRMLEHVMDFIRWGMGGAKPRFLDQKKSLMVDSNKLATIIPGREHHADWAQAIDHPDANFIAASRTLLPAMADELERLRELLKRCEDILEKFHVNNETCVCPQCELYREVRRVNQETPDAT